MAIFPPVRPSVVQEYIGKVAEASGTHSPAQVLQAFSGAQKYGRESLDHVITGWTDYSGIINAHMPNIFSNN